MHIRFCEFYVYNCRIFANYKFVDFRAAGEYRGVRGRGEGDPGGALLLRFHNQVCSTNI